MKERKKLEYLTPTADFFTIEPNNVIATSATVTGSRTGEYGGVITDAWS